MKTLVLSQIFPPTHGGSGRWLWELYSRLPKDDYVIVTDKVENTEEFDKTAPVCIERIPLFSTEWGILSRVGLFFYIKTIIKLIRIIRREKITFIHCGRCLPEGVMALILKKIMSIKYISFIHGEDIETARTSRELSFLVKAVLKNAKTLICNSHNTANLVQYNWHIDKNKINVLHPGVDLVKFKPANEDLDFKKKMGWVNKKVILTVGRLQERKGQDRMVEAMADIVKNTPQALYVLVGSGDDLSRLNTLTLQLKLGDFVQFITDADDDVLLKCYQQCDLFILPNRTVGNDIEGFGMVLVEAQACGKPVIAGDSGGTREAVFDSRSLVVDCQSASVIAMHVSELLSVASGVSESSSGDSCVAHLSWEMHVDRFMDLIEKN